MRKGMTATQVIVALALGLIIIVGLGYLVWTWIVRGGGEANIQYCKTHAFTYCSQARLREKTQWFEEENPECESFNFVIDKNGGGSYCNDILGEKPLPEGR